MTTRYETDTTDPGTAVEEIEAVPVRHPGRWIAMLVVLFLVAVLVYNLITNPRYEWDVVFEYFTVHNVLVGLWHTILLTVVCMSLGIVGGIILAVMRLSPNPVLSIVSWIYIWFFRGTPLLVQILFWGYLAALIPRLYVGVPFGGPKFGSIETKSLLSLFVVAIVALSLNEAAYMAEIVRSGIQSIPAGQIEAAQSLGMSRGLMMRRIVLPQAMRVIIPPTGNETVSMLKDTALVSVISFLDLLYAVQLIYSRTYQTIPLLITASIWYLILTTLLTIGQYYVERHFGRGSSRELPPTPLQRARRVLFGRRFVPDEVTAPTDLSSQGGPHS